MLPAELRTMLKCIAYYANDPSIDVSKTRCGIIVGTVTVHEPYDVKQCSAQLVVGNDGIIADTVEFGWLLPSVRGSPRRPRTSTSPRIFLSPQIGAACLLPSDHQGRRCH